jgi:hypothetical protein
MTDANDDTEATKEYIMMVNQIFGSEKQGYEHYNRYVKEKEFSVRLDEKEYVAGTKEAKGRRFVCSREGTVFLPEQKRVSLADSLWM